MTEPLQVDFAVEFPYRHSTGPAIARFLEGLRDRVIWGRRCDACGLVVVPANDHCETCGGGLGAWVEVGPGGTVTGLTTLAGGRTFVRVRLDGAGTDLLHLAAGEVAAGDRVRAAWAAERTGSILDLAGFDRTGSGDADLGEPPPAPAAGAIESIRTELRMPFRFSAGRLMTRFAEGVRRGELHAVRCPECGSRYVPPRPACPRCWVRTEGWERVADEGVVETFVVVNVPFQGQEVEIPYVLAHVRLDGADVSFLHLIGEPGDEGRLRPPPDGVRLGMRVRAAWRAPRERTGFLSEDVDHFEPVEGESQRDSERD